jgi:hypothetical protein
MGQFSWIYSDIEKQVIDNKVADTYLLVPKSFQEKYGKAIYEDCYDGYGRFGKYDVYDLIPEWNREMIPEIIRRIKNGNWYCSTSENDIQNLQAYYDGKEIDCELRWLGIIMACYDEDNSALEYPIKITTKEMEYDNVSPSLSDPNQGWEQYEDDDEDDEW